MKKATMILMTILLIVCTAFPVMASENANNRVITFENGSYMVITLEMDQYSRTLTPQVTKTYTYYNASDDRQWAYTLTAQFTYDGSSAEAIVAKPAAIIYNRDWVLTDSDAYCQGAAAIGEAVFEHSTMGAVPITVTIRCDKNGNIT